MTDAQKAYLQPLADVRSWHRWQISQSVGDVRTMQAHEAAIAWIGELIATKERHAAEDEAERGGASALRRVPAPRMATSLRVASCDVRLPSGGSDTLHIADPDWVRRSLSRERHVVSDVAVVI